MPDRYVTNALVWMGSYDTERGAGEQRARHAARSGNRGEA